MIRASAGAVAFLLAFSAAVAMGDADSGRARPVPSKALYERLKNGPEIIGIVHWGLNTFTDREWGYGDEKPELLSPAAFDADAIVKACKAGGIGGLVVVAKHHDGFCLWPTKTTSHNISRAPFRGGKGDYVREMAQACRANGLKFGVYVSPWDRNSPYYGSDKYVTEVFHEQIKELLGGAYGEIFEMWFDGANGGGGYYGGAKEIRKIGSVDKYYRYDEVYRFVRKLQPGIAIFAGENDASDFRWPGNECGFLEPESRATVLSVGGFADGKYGNPAYKAQINTGCATGTFFRVCEADFPLRKGWFFHENQRGLTKNAAYLTRIYTASVGNGGTMNIGIAPNKDGKLDPEDITALKGFTVMREALFAKEVKDAGAPFNVVVMREDIAKGEQVDGWSLLADGKEILAGKAIGRCRIRLLPKACSAKKVELKITASGGIKSAVEVRRYYADPQLVLTVMEAEGLGGETDTARWMQGPARHK